MATAAEHESLLDKAISEGDVESVSNDGRLKIFTDKNLCKIEIGITLESS
jgi:hypothetical protein